MSYKSTAEIAELAIQINELLTSKALVPFQKEEVCAILGQLIGFEVRRKLLADKGD